MHKKIQNSKNKSSFFNALGRIFKTSKRNLSTKKNLVNDFVVIKQQNTTHVLNAISPAWSASFAFADYLIDQSNL